MMTHRIDTQENEYLSHLLELHQRVLVCVLVLVSSVIIGWFLYPVIYQFVAEPVLSCVRAQGGRVITLHPAEAFLTRMKLSAMAGLVLASPVVLWQLWAFVRPGLLPHERRVVAPLVPGVIFLFLLGAGIGYLTLPAVLTFFIQYVPEGVTATYDFQQSINLPLLVMLAFGIAFQLPIVLLGLVWLRVLTPQVMIKQWRFAIFGLAVFAAVVTPSVDPISMILMMAPLAILYFVTIWVALRLQVQRDLPDKGGE